MSEKIEYEFYKDFCHNGIRIYLWKCPWAGRLTKIKALTYGRNKIRPIYYDDEKLVVEEAKQAVDALRKRVYEK